MSENYAINLFSNLNHVYPYNGADDDSRTRGEIEGRKSIARLVRWLNENVPGYEHAYVAACSPTVAARESRRILGNAYITGDDYVRGACPADSVCYSFYPIDVHQGADRVGIPGRQDRLQQLRTVCGWDRTLQQRWSRLSEPEK